MYFGSVRFFKHLIIFILALLILVPTSVAIYLGITLYRASLPTPPAEDTQISAEAGTQQGDAAQQPDEPVQQTPQDEQTPPAQEQQSAPSGGAPEQTLDEDILSADLAYRALFPDMYVEPAESFQYSQNTVYLTFDDGPSYITTSVLDALDWQEVPATFFVVYRPGEDGVAYLNRIVEGGHTIGIHSYSHEYTKIYASVEAFLTDFYQVWNWVYETTGVRSSVFRFPGGSVNGYNRDVYVEIIAEMTRRGFTYYDWNVSSGDAAATEVPSSAIFENVVSGVRSSNRAIVLMHDGRGHSTTANALPDIIRTLQEEGYTFAPLTNDVYPIIFGYHSVA